MYSGGEDTIAAISTAAGIGAIAVVRISGSKTFTIVNNLFSSKDIMNLPSHTLHYGTLKEKDIIDEVVISLFKAPHSYTGEDIIEISCHGSPYIQQQVLNALIHQGARLAQPGEFTQRAFLNGKLDLTQAEAVGDLIASQTHAAQQTALNQLRGGFKNELEELRERLINFAALIELELDFSDEDVEFADRTQFIKLIDQLLNKIKKLLDSFALGNAIKNGVSIAIIGKPNAGKSTLLNALLNEERAIVSDIAGTTRDAIEEQINIDGILFRLIDTAGIREHSTDQIEKIGIERSIKNAEKADIILHLIDLIDNEEENLDWLQQFTSKTIVVYNKADAYQISEKDDANSIFISAKEKKGLEELKILMFEKAIGSAVNTENTIITSARHHDALEKMYESLKDIKSGMKEGISSDLLSIDIRRTLHYLGEITGRVEVDRDILGTIFGKFCIGK